MAEIITGTVKWFNAEKGFGFITSTEQGDLYVHVRALEQGQTTLTPGEPVYFSVRDTPRGLEAVQVRVGTPPPPPKPAQPTIELAGERQAARVSLRLVVRPVEPRPLLRAGKRRPSAYAFVVELDAASLAALPPGLPPPTAPTLCLVLVPIKHWEHVGSDWRADPESALAISGMIALSPQAPGMLTLYAHFCERVAAGATRPAARKAQPSPEKPGE